MNNRELCKELGARSGIKGYLIERALKHLGPVIVENLNKGGAVVLSSVGTFKRGKFRYERVSTIKGKTGIVPAHHPVQFKVAGAYKKLP